MASKIVEIKKWNVATTWVWDVVVDNCAICRNNIMDNCIQCQIIAATDDNCTLAWGICNHIFHLHCITKWIQTRAVCPLDNSEWDFQKLEKKEIPAVS